MQPQKNSVNGLMWLWCDKQLLTSISPSGCIPDGPSYSPFLSLPRRSSRESDVRNGRSDCAFSSERRYSRSWLPREALPSESRDLTPHISHHLMHPASRTWRPMNLDHSVISYLKYSQFQVQGRIIYPATYVTTATHWLLISIFLSPMLPHIKINSKNHHVAHQAKPALDAIKSNASM